MGDFFRKKNVGQILAQLQESKKDNSSLNKKLSVKDLTGFGIAAIIGAGIFSTIGKASFDGGPAVIFLFIFTAIACSFAAFAYAEFASLIPVSGSAYTYSYVAFGEIIAWIIGWSLIMEYSVGNITVAISWSDYFTGFLANPKIGINIPQWMQMDFLSARNGFIEAQKLLSTGFPFEQLPINIQEAYTAWDSSPNIGGIHIVLDLPALLIIFIITWLVYRGIKESRNASNAMVVVKIAIILLVIAIGIFYVDTKNWSPFAPNGITGILKGVSAVFFAYIGFDAISTTAEECENPQRDLPRGMMWSIIICTIIYVLVALILTGVVHYSELNVGDPLLLIFEKLDMQWLSGVIGVSAIIAMASVLLVFQMGQPRIWMSMSRDGLLPKKFSKIHPKYKTPSFSTIVVGFVVAIPALFLNLDTVTDLCSIGTLFAFIMVCAGVLVLQNNPNVPKGKFKTPYVNSKYIIPFFSVVAILYFTLIKPKETKHFLFNESQIYSPKDLISNISREKTVLLTDFISEDKEITNNNILDYLSQLDNNEYEKTIIESGLSKKEYTETGFSLFAHKIPTWLFIIFMVIMNYFCFRYKLSLIPTLGLISCFYMMSELELSNWIGFFIWLVIGLIIYFTYSYKHSKLNINKN